MNLVSVFELLVFPHMTADDGETVNLIRNFSDGHNIVTGETCDKYISRVEYDYDEEVEGELTLVSFHCKFGSHPIHNDRAWAYNYLHIGDRV